VQAKAQTVQECTVLQEEAESALTAFCNGSCLKVGLCSPCLFDVAAGG
jgi:hypothetical protein